MKIRSEGTSFEIEKILVTGEKVRYDILSWTQVRSHIRVLKKSAAAPL